MSPRTRIAGLTVAALLTAAATAQTDDARDVLRAAEGAFAARPDDPAARFQLARALGWNARYDDALAILDALVADYPDNLDYRLQQARTLLWMDRLAPARAALDAIETRDAAYPGLGALREQLAERLAARDTPAAVTPARANPEPPEPRAGPGRGEWRVTAGVTLESLTGGRDGWNAQSLDLDRTTPEGLRWGAGMTTSARFDERDTTLAVRGGGSPAAGWQLDASAAFTPGAAFSPSRQFGVGVRRALPRGWVAGADVSARRYPGADVDILSLLGERYVGAFRLAWRASFSWLDGDDRTLSNAVSADWYRDGSNSFGVVLATGRESEAIAAGRVLQTDVRSVTLTGRHDLNESLTLRWFAGTHDQGDIYRRNYAGLSLTTRF